MADNKLLGIVFSDMHDAHINELTANRTTASVPFGGRYRLVDFVLSNFVNAGVDEVGIITKSNYLSLMDHVSGGKEWDLARKHGGLTIFPPYSNATNGVYRGNIEALNGIINYITTSKKSYVVMAHCDVVASIDYKKMLESHIESGAALTVAYQDSKNMGENTLLSLDIGKDNQLNGILPEDGGDHVYVNTTIINTDVLVREVKLAARQNKYDFMTELMPSLLQKEKVNCYNLDTIALPIECLQSYFNANMQLLKRDTLKELFSADRPVYTKVRDEVPAIYGLDCKCTNSAIADGCIIDGTVENSIIFRGVTVGKGAKVSNCILMQGTVVAENCELEYIITDKDVVVGEDRHLRGVPNYPFYIAKNTEV